jgi:hypothetical protein
MHMRNFCDCLVLMEVGDCVRLRLVDGGPFVILRPA